MKKIKQFFKDLNGMLTLCYLVVNIDKLTKFQKELMLRLVNDAKDKKITLNQLTDELVIIKRNYKMK